MGSSPFLACLALCLAFPDDVLASASYDRSADQHGFTIFMRDGGWCWFQDPRAVVSGSNLFVGGVQGNGSGPVKVSVFDLGKSRLSGETVLRDNYDRDDHNAPAFHVRPDGSVVAVYARHARDKMHCYRISDPEDPLEWGSEKTFTHDYLRNDRVTYMNLLHLDSEGRLYNFFRGIDFNPAFIVSKDHGLSWEDQTHFIRSELEGRNRPYVRYAGNGEDTIHLAFTDGHPRDFGNSIYYAGFRDGAFHSIDGERIKSLDQDGPLMPSEADLVYRGSGKPGRGAHLSAPGSAWTSSIAIDQDDRPHLAYSLYLANDDNRFRIASWNGSKWIDREVAYAGRCLYDKEASYTGLITLDPDDPRFVVVSSDVHPKTGKPGSGKHEIYTARIKEDDTRDSIAWKPLTENSPVDNLRPVIVREGRNRIILWNRGEFRTFVDYQLDTVGLVQKNGQ